MKKTVLLSFICLLFNAFSQNKPKLIVGIVVDQMCYDYIYRYESKLSKNGFLKLLNEGTSCENTHYNYVPTFTGPGHASIYTGTTPSNHGIVANEWYHRGLKREVNCVEDTAVNSVGTSSKEGQCSPSNFKTTNIADQLKLADKNSKVLAISIKNRSAILPGGHLSDGSYWFDYTTGNMITSTFYTDKLPNWVEIFNQQKQAENYLKKTWNTLLPIEKYTESEADDSKYEVLIGNKISPTFPYNFEELSIGRKNFDLFTISPFANTFLTDFSIEALKKENLGKDNSTDILAISYSTPDIAGHSFGPYSVEIEDMYLRLDLDIAKLISELEKSIGKDNFVLFLTADHAVVPVPQYLIDKKLPGGYLYISPLKKELNDILTKKFGENVIEAIENNNIYLNRALIVEKKWNKNDIEETIKNILLTKSEIKSIYKSDELQAANSSDEWIKMVKKGYRYHESGDMIFLLESGYLPKSKDTEKSHKGTSHGSAFNYDTHVPLLWYGKNIPAKKVYRKVEIVDIVSTLAPMLNLTLPSTCNGNPIIEVLK
jgi:predicted AlkP superfamily pyrophosphatase or phosphodiesterase